MSDAAGGPDGPDGTSGPGRQRRWYHKRRYLLPIAFILGFAAGRDASDEPEDPVGATERRPPIVLLESDRTTVTTRAPTTTTRATTTTTQAPTTTTQAPTTTQTPTTTTQAPTTTAPPPPPTTAELPRATTTAAPAPEVYYRNCTEARAAGPTPIYEGEPGYGRHLDRDGDGIACE